MSASRFAEPLVALLCAAIAIASAGGVLPAPWLFVFKPLTTLLIIAHAWRRDGGSPAVRRWVLIGLLFSLGGDVALLWPREGFLPGLVSFLLAHLAYLVAFTRQVPFAARRWPFVVYALAAGGILSQLWPGVPESLRIPVVAYVLCLSAMAAQAAAVWRMSQHNGDARRAAVLALGGALFVVSDALLATNKFHGALPLASLWILSSYWAAQWCIASWLKPREFALR
ncbi:putative membrane protein [Burkholderiaceae bacterium]|nr:putative membrane protein [Burkholderiaceae bacterium]